MHRRAFLATGVGAAAAALAGCSVVGGEGDTPAGDYDVGMTPSRFEPAAVTVAAGETVVWRNTSSHAHTVTAYADGIPAAAEYFASGGYDGERAAERGWLDGGGGGLYEGDTYEHTFAVPGEYRYFCIPHEQSGMRGVVTVTESTTTA